EDEHMLGPGGGRQVREVGVEQHDLGPAMVEDVLDLGRGEAEVDRNEDAPPAGDAEEGHQQAGGVVRHAGYACAPVDAELVQGRGLWARSRKSRTLNGTFMVSPRGCDGGRYSSCRRARELATCQRRAVVVLRRAWFPRS